MARLFEPINLGAVEIKNRIVMPPMCMYKAKDNNGKPRCFHKLHYGARALGGVGLIIVEATAVEARGRISNADLGLWCEEQLEDHAELVKQVKKYGAKVCLQIAHAGRKSTCNDLECVAPCAIAFSEDYKIPRLLSTDEIIKIKDAFVNSAFLAKKAGYDMVEIHAAHGYLLHEFLSPLTNKRDDIYGGNFENRVRILKEIMQEIRLKNITFGVRISAREWENGEFGIKDSMELAKIIEKQGGAYVHVSAGGNHAKPSLVPEFTPLYQCEYAKEIKKSVKIPVIAVGKITTASEGEALLLGDVCDMVAYGRKLLQNPNFAQEAMAEFHRYDLIEKPYLRAF